MATFGLPAAGFSHNERPFRIAVLTMRVTALIQATVGVALLAFSTMSDYFGPADRSLFSFSGNVAICFAALTAAMSIYLATGSQIARAMAAVFTVADLAFHFLAAVLTVHDGAVAAVFVLAMIVDAIVIGSLLLQAPQEQVHPATAELVGSPYKQWKAALSPQQRAANDAAVAAMHAAWSHQVYPLTGAPLWDGPRLPGERIDNGETSPAASNRS
jgi:hypothetical protein